MTIVTVSPLLERERELDQFALCRARAMAGDGWSVLVDGDAGLGKTRLLDAHAAQAAAEGFRVLRARGRELEQGLSYGVVRELLGELIDDRGPDGALVLTGDAFAICHGLYWLLANASAETPIAVVIDDAHWADRVSLRWLAYTATRLDGLAILITAATRSKPGELPELEPMRSTEFGSVLAVQPLSAQATGELVTRSAPQSDHTLAQACHTLTGGNPFLLSELLDRVGDGALPISAQQRDPISRFVLERLDRQGTVAVALAEACAIVGEGGALRHAAHVADLDVDAAELAADALVQARILQSGQPISFVHPLVAAAIRDRLPAGRWSVGHRRVARQLETEGDLARAAMHLLQVQAGGQQWVVDRLVDQARRTLRGGDAPTAATLLARALQEPPAPAGRRELLESLGEAELLAGSRESIAHLREARALAVDPVHVERSTRMLASALLAHGPVADAGAALADALVAIGDDDDEDGRRARLRAELLAIAQTEHSLAARLRSELEHSAAHALGTSTADRIVLAAEGYQRALTWTGAAADTADMLTKAFSDNLVAEVGCESPIVGLGVTGLVVTGAWACAESVVEELQQDAERQRSTRGLAQAATLRARLAFARGNLAQAEVEARLAVEVSSHCYPMLMPFALAVLVVTLAAAGETEAAGNELATRGFLDGDLAPTTPGTLLTVARMVLRREMGDVRGSLKDLERLRGFVKGHGSFPMPWVPDVVATFVAADQSSAALDLAATHLAHAERWAHPVDLAAALRAQASLHPQRAVELLGRAAALLDDSGAALARAATLADYGAALRRTNHRAEARGPLTEALDLAHRCGAAPLAAFAHTELTAAGARPRSVVRTGLDALTPSEVRIATLAASGASNPQIAQGLFITRKTVERHLGNVYRKLDISTRTELAALLGATSSSSETSVPTS